MLSRHPQLLRALRAAYTTSQVVLVPRANMASKPKGKVYTLNDANVAKKQEYSSTKAKDLKSVRVAPSSPSSTPSSNPVREAPEEVIPGVEPEFQALIDKIDAVEEAIFAGKRVKTAYIDKLMRACIRRNQYHLVSNCFVLFDEEYYLADEEDGDVAVDEVSDTIDIRPPTPTYVSYVTALYAAAAIGNVELTQSLLLLLSGEDFDIPASSAELAWLDECDPSVWGSLHEMGLVLLAEARRLDIAATPAAAAATTADAAAAAATEVPIESKSGHLPSLLTVLACMMANDTKSAARAVTSLPSTLLAEAPQLYLPLIVHSLYASDRVDAVPGFLNAAADAGAVSTKPLLEALMTVASAHEHRLHTLVYFDGHFAGTSTAPVGTASSESGSGSLHALSLTLAKATPVERMLWERQEAIMDASSHPERQLWLQLSCDDGTSNGNHGAAAVAAADASAAAVNNGAEAKAASLFSKVGSHLMPLTHAYAAHTLFPSAEGQHASDVPSTSVVSGAVVITNAALFPPSRQAIIDVLQALRGLPGPYWYAVQRASPVLWRETVIVSEIGARLGYSDKAVRSLALLSCLNARKPVQVLYLCERILADNISLRARLAADIVALLGANHVPALPISAAAVTQADYGAAVVPTTTETDTTMMRDSGDMAWALCTRILNGIISEKHHFTRMRRCLDVSYYAHAHLPTEPFMEMEEDEDGLVHHRKLTTQAAEGLVDALLLSDKAMRAAALLCVVAGVDVQKTFSAPVALALAQETNTPGFWPLAHELRAACVAGMCAAGARIVDGRIDMKALGETTTITRASTRKSSSLGRSRSKNASVSSSAATSAPASPAASAAAQELADASFIAALAPMSHADDAAAMHPHVEVLPHDWLHTMWSRTLLALATHTADAITAPAAVELWAAAQLAPLPSPSTSTAHAAVLAALVRVQEGAAHGADPQQIQAPTASQSVTVAPEIVYARVLDTLRSTNVPSVVPSVLYDIAAKRFQWPLQVTSSATAGEVSSSSIV